MRTLTTLVAGMALFSALVFASCKPGVSQEDKSKSSQKEANEIVALKDVMIHSMTGEPAYVGTILISNGKISEIGKTVEIPKDAITHELKDFHATPGLIESRGRLWLTSGANSETNTKAELNVVDAIDPWSEDWQELASQGITAVYVQMNSQSSIGGFGAVLKVCPGGEPEQIVLNDKVAIQVALGTKGRSSKDRHAQVQALDKLIESAKDKKKTEDSKDKGKESSDSKEDAKEKQESEKKDSDSDKEKSEKEDAKKESEKKDEKKDVTKEIFKRVLKREIPLFIEVHHSDTLKKVLKLVEKHEIRVVLDGLTKVSSASDELVESGIPMVIGPIQETGTVPEYRKDADLGWVASASQSDPLWSLATFAGNARGSRLLRVQAAAAIRAGVRPDSVLAALTKNPARMLGISDRVGTLEKGKQADIAIFGGDPLEPSTRVRMVLSNGKVTFEQKGPSAGSNAALEMDSALPDDLPPEFAVKSNHVFVGGEFKPATLVIRNGKIQEIAAEAGDGLAVFDLGEATITPGLVLASSTLGQAASLLDNSESDASHLRAVDAIDPTNKNALKLMSGGFVHVGIAPSQQNTSSGVVGHIRLGTGDYVAEPAIASQFVISQAARNQDRFPASVNGQLQMIDRLLDGDVRPSRVYVSRDIAESIKQEKSANLTAVAEGSNQAIVIGDTDLEIRHAIDLAKRRNLKLILQSSGRIGKYADVFAKNKIGVIMPQLKGDEYDAVLNEFVEVCNADVPIAFAGETAHGVRMTAAMLIQAGVDRTRVMNGLTSGGATLVGMGETGLSKDAPADFVVWTGDPTLLSSKPLNVVVDGKSQTLK